MKIKQGEVSSSPCRVLPVGPPITCHRGHIFSRGIGPTHYRNPIKIPHRSAHCRSWKGIPCDVSLVSLVRRGLRLSCSRQEPGHDPLVGVSAAANLVLVDRLLSECRGLLLT